MPTPQPGVFHDGATAHWFGHFEIRPTTTPADVRHAVTAARARVAQLDDVHLVVAFGSSCWLALGATPDETPGQLRPLTAIVGADGRTMVATQADLFLWLQSTRVDLNLHAIVELRPLLDPVATLARETVSHTYLDLRDLTGFVDGSANPKQDERFGVALIPEGEPGAGGSYVLGQKWRHDLDRWRELSVAQQEAVIGRTKPDSMELDPHPAGSHLDRVVVEDRAVEELEIYRRSVPWGSWAEHGLYFLAFTADLSIIDLMLQRMFGASEDGAHDRLTDFVTPVSGAYYFAPPLELLVAVLGR